MKILCYGDSNTLGWDPTDIFGGPYPDPWPKILASLLRCECVNLGMPGREIPAGSRELSVMLAQIRQHLPADRIIILLGTNDILNGTEGKTAAKRISDMLSFLKEQLGMPILLLGIPQIGFGDSMAGSAAELNRELTLAAEAFGIPFRSTSDFHLPLAFDGIHLTEEGHRMLAEAVASAIKIT